MTDAKPYTLAEVKTGGVLYVNHGRIAATVEALERAEAALAAVTAERDRMREALVNLEAACASVASWSSESIDYSDPARVAARAALASTPAPASMPIAEVEALKMRVAEAVRTAMVGVTVFDALARSEMRELDLAAVVKGVK